MTHQRLEIVLTFLSNYNKTNADSKANYLRYMKEISTGNSEFTTIQNSILMVTRDVARHDCKIASFIDKFQR